MTVAVLAVVLVYADHRSPPDAASLNRGSTTGSPSPSASRLSLVSSHVYLNSAGDYWTVEGSVKNLTTDTLTNLHVVSTWFDHQSKVVDSHIDLVDLKRITPGEVSTFRSATPARPDIASLRLAFESDVGALLLAVDGSTVTMPR